MENAFKGMAWKKVKYIANRKGKLKTLRKDAYVYNVKKKILKNFLIWCEFKYEAWRTVHS